MLYEKDTRTPEIFFRYFKTRLEGPEIVSHCLKTDIRDTRNSFTLLKKDPIGLPDCLTFLKKRHWGLVRLILCALKTLETFETKRIR